MLRLHTRKGGFTLIELMIVVAIIGILAAIAIPNFLRFQLRSRAGEGKTNLAAIRTAEEGYSAEFNTYVQANTLVPRLLAGLNGDKANWPVPPALAPGFDTVGWQPEGEVYYSYQVTAGPPGCPAAGLPCNHFTAEGVSDIDGDGAPNWWGYVKPDAFGVTIIGTSCPTTGVYNGVTNANDLLATVGPCAATFGQSVF